MISVLIADSQRLLAETLAISLRLEPDIDVIADYPTRGQAAIEVVLERRPDVSLIDFWIGGMEGPAVVRGILGRAPESRICMLSWFATSQQARQVLDAGALAFLPKTVQVHDVAQAVRRAQTLRSPALLLGPAGTIGLDKSPESATVGVLNLLTPREIEILGHLRSFGRLELVARQMLISPGTVRNHVQSILKKLGVHSQLEAIAEARRQGLIS